MKVSIELDHREAMWLIGLEMFLDEYPPEELVATVKSLRHRAEEALRVALQTSSSAKDRVS
ncbi:hypothetical protein SEA_GRECOETEREO_84 [Mycobacterium phage GrecoEtereo]|nr:hypothetical protein SEA_GRECOETEREO_84 [Mycobacterium phage GrecoEtereo]